MVKVCQVLYFCMQVEKSELLYKTYDRKISDALLHVLISSDGAQLFYNILIDFQTADEKIPTAKITATLHFRDPLPK